MAMPKQSHRPVTVVPDGREALIDKEIAKLREKGAVVQVQAEEDQGFFLNPFLGSKKESGEMRSVVNLRPLNKFLPHIYFKMEGLHVIPDLIQENDWLCKIDLKDAYFAIPV